MAGHDAGGVRDESGADRRGAQAVPRGVVVAGAAADGSVTFRYPLPVPAAEAWDAVTVPARLATWLGPVHGDLGVGGTYEVRMGADEPGSDQNATGVVRSCDPPRGYEVTWGFPGEPVSEIAVRLETTEAGADLVLVHSGLTADAAAGYGAGWHTSLDRLHDHLTGRPVRDWDALFARWLPHYRDAATS